MKLKSLPSLNRLQELFTYCPETGELRWKQRTSRRVKVGDVAGVDSQGYVSVGVDGGRFLAHRLIGVLLFNLGDDVLVDHRNGNGLNNRKSNLRVAVNGQADNCQNAALSRANKSGHTGVFWDEARGCFQAAIVVQRKKIHLGRYAIADEAAVAYALAKQQKHAFQPNVVGKR